MSDADRAYELAREKIAEAVGKGFVWLDFRGEEFHSLDRLPPEIAKFAGLRELILTGTQITDLALMAGLADLQRLSLDSTPITNITTLADLMGLQSVTLDNTRITDIAPLAQLDGLLSVTLNDTQITDIAPLEKLIGLEILSLVNTRITDISPLEGMTELQRLLIGNSPINDFTTLSKLTGLQRLVLGNLEVTDLVPLACLRNLQALTLTNTPITELAPLAGLTELKYLNVATTQVSDLRPISSMDKLGEAGGFGLHFDNIPATKRDARLAELAQIDDAQDRTRQTLDYLRSLPPWPKPYTPAATPDGSPPQPIGGVPAAPDPDQVPRLVLGPDDRIDLPPVLPTEAEMADPIRERLYQRLPSALDGLLRQSNRYPELDSPARALRGMVDAPFDQADFLLIHLEINALTDIRASQDDRSETEKLDVDCLAALAGVLRIAPPITMGHPDIELLEERGRAYQRSRLPETVAAAESQIARGLDKHELATERTQEFARRTAAAGETGRVAEMRSGFTKNVVLIMYFITEQATSAAYGHVFGTPTVAAAQFLLTHKDAILATAPSWGQSGFAWAQYVMIHAQRIIDEARKPD